MRERLERFVLPAAFLFFAAVAVFYFSNYGHWFIHPHQFEIHLPKLLESGLHPTPRSFLNIFQQFDPSESRPRFLAYAIIWANLHLRMWLYDWFVLFPPFSIGWLVEALIGPYLLFRLVRNMTGEKTPAWIALIVYVSSIGFLSGFAMPLMPSKPLTGVVFIATLWIFSELKLRAAPGQFAHEVPGAKPYLRGLCLVLLAGLFLDEVPVFAFLLPLIFYRELLVPPKLERAQVRQAASSWLPLVLPPLVFLFIVVVLVPPLTQKFFHYRFDYISSLFVNREAAESGKTFFAGKLYGFGVDSLLANFVSLVASALLPYQVAPYSSHPSGGGVITGMEVAALPCAAVAAFLALAVWIGIKGRKPAAQHLIATVATTVAFVIFMSLLSGRHVPYISGYVYGCSVSVFLAMGIGLAYAALRDMRLRWSVAVLALWMGAVQFMNFDLVNRDWIVAHNDGWVYKEYKEKLPIAGDGRPTSREELREIWQAWADGGLEDYLRRSTISSGAVFLVFELRLLTDKKGSRR